jgi:hypothetical protein
MSRGARLTIMGLYNYNNNVFRDFNVPDGMDKSTAIDAILLECSDLELIYPSFTLMQAAIKNWSDVESTIWEKLYATETAEYNPLWNVDATVEEVLDGTGVGSTKGYNSTSWLENEKAKTDNTVTTTRTGNIGVTSSQQLLQQERDIADFTTYKFIVNSFKKRFCVMVY